MQITTEWLRKHRACPDGVTAFRAEFGESARLTRANLLRAAGAELDMGWAADELVPLDKRDAYDAAIREPQAAYYAAIANAIADVLGLA